ncbi:MAG TPA: hypothetical protein VGW09_07355 [Nitrososphaeraceae archaeon]|nr:hypothetical protein [Nitrososphaeraceae archaeon]
MKALARDKTRTRGSMKIESAIEILSEILGSREEVATMLSEDCPFSEKQRWEILEEIKRLHGGNGVESYARK